MAAVVWDRFTQLRLSGDLPMRDRDRRRIVIRDHARRRYGFIVLTRPFRRPCRAITHYIRAREAHLREKPG